MKLPIIIIRSIQIIAGLGIATGCLSIFMVILSRFVKHPANLGVNNGKLAPCPNMPNCVSTQSKDARHQIDPITYQTSPTRAQTILVDVINVMERTEIIVNEPGYLYVEFRTKGMGYVDDVEFAFNSEEHVIHFRSSASVPYTDWGMNRKRMEVIRKAFMNAESASP